MKKDEKRIIIIVLVAASVFIYFLIWCWFITDGHISTGSGLTKADWLSFLGGFLAFVGTVFLGVVAFWQNKEANKETQRANEINEKLLDLNEQANRHNEMLLNIERNRHSCVIMLEKPIPNIEPTIISNDVTLNGKILNATTWICLTGENNLIFCIKNYGEVMLKKIKICLLNSGETISEYLTIAKNDSKHIAIVLSEDYGNIENNKVRIEYVSCNNDTTYGEFIIKKNNEGYNYLDKYIYFGLEDTSHE